MRDGKAEKDDSVYPDGARVGNAIANLLAMNRER